MNWPLSISGVSVYKRFNERVERNSHVLGSWTRTDPLAGEISRGSRDLERGFFIQSHTRATRREPNLAESLESEYEDIASKTRK